MKILYVITGLGVGGAERQLVNLADSLSFKNEIIIVSLTSTPIFLPENPQIKVFNLSGEKHILSFFQLIFKFIRLIKFVEPDIIHAHMFHAIIISRIAQFFYTKSIHISSSHCINEMHDFRMLYYRITDSLTDWSTNVSQSAWMEYIQKRAWSKNKSSIVENGIDCERFHFKKKSRSSIRAKLNLNTKTKVILTVGRLVEEKDYHLMLKAFSELLVIKNDVLLIIIGDGNLRSDLVNYSNHLNIKEKTLFLGSQTNISEWLSACDLFILTSKFEGFGLVVAEAMACERVVVAVKSGEVENIIGDYGFIENTRDSKKLASLLVEVLELNTSVLNEIGLKARKRIIELYSIEKISSKWLDIYSKFISKKSINV